MNEGDRFKKDLEYLNKSAKDWLNIQCKFEHDRAKCKRYQNLSQEYDMAHDRLRSELQICTDFINYRPAYKVHIETYHNCITLVETELKLMLSSFSQKFKSLDATYKAKTN